VAPEVAGGTLTLVGLDAGTLTLTGPAGLAMTLAPQVGFKGQYGGTLAAGAIPSSGGSFTFTGSGGADVGSFTSTVTLSNPTFNWTNQGAAATVDRTQGLTVAWIGGNPGTYVYIGGSLLTASGLIEAYGCRIAVEAGQFTVPSYILLGMPAGSGSTTVNHQINLTFSAAGLDTSGVVGEIEFSVPSIYK
jgi:hypothetical protein